MNTLTEKERQAVEMSANKYTKNIWRNGRPFGSAIQYSKQDYIAGAEFLAELRKEEAPSEPKTITKEQHLEAFQCKVCGEQFGNMSDLYDHYNETHNHPQE